METQATLIYHFKNDRYINIKVFNNGKIQMTGVRSKEEAEMVVINLIEIIKNTNIEKTEWDTIVKMSPGDIIKNEYLYTTIDGVNKVMRHIMTDGVSKWIETPDELDLVNNKSLTADNSTIKMTEFQIVMINSNYSVGFNIDRTKLHLILKRKYNIYATFESTYQAVKSYYKSMAWYEPIIQEIVNKGLIEFYLITSPSLGVMRCKTSLSPIYNQNPKRSNAGRKPSVSPTTLPFLAIAGCF